MPEPSLLWGAGALFYGHGLANVTQEPRASSASTSEAQYEAATDFIIQVFDLMPTASAEERELYLMAGKPGLAKRVRENAGNAFFIEKARFRVWAEERYGQFALGHGFPDAMAALRRRLPAFLSCPMHAYSINDISAELMERAVVEAALSSVGESRQRTMTQPEFGPA